VSLRRWLAEPLVHFLLAGLALFVAVAWWQGRTDEGRTIRLSREDLVVFLQGRAQVYDRESFAALLARMPARERKALVHDAALYEALYREGIALDLAQADPLIRQRIVQQMRQLTPRKPPRAPRSATPKSTPITSASRRLPRRAAGELHPCILRRAPGAEAAARAELAALRASTSRSSARASTASGSSTSSTTPRPTRRWWRAISATRFARQLFALRPGGWQGPLHSQYGWHLVLLRALTPAGLPPLAEIATACARTRSPTSASQLANAALDQLLARYQVVVEPGADRMIRLLAALLLAALAVPALADDNRPLTIRVADEGRTTYRVTWKIPANVEARSCPR
jgi:hypothetical protein